MRTVWRGGKWAFGLLVAALLLAHGYSAVSHAEPSRLGFGPKASSRSVPASTGPLLNPGFPGRSGWPAAGEGRDLFSSEFALQPADPSAQSTFTLTYDPGLRDLLITDEQSGAMAIYHSGGTPTILGVGLEPAAVALDPISHEAYVADAGSGTVTPVALEAGEAGSPFPAGPSPEAVALSSQELWAASGSNASLTVVDLTNRALVGTVALSGTPVSVAASPQSNTVWALVPSMDELVAVNASTLQVEGTRLVGAGANSLSAPATTGEAFVTNSIGRNVSVFDFSSTLDLIEEVANPSLASAPSEAIPDPVTGSVAVLEPGTGTLLLLNGSSGVLASTEHVPSGVTGILPIGSSGELFAIEPASGEVLDLLPTGAELLDRFGGGLFYWGSGWLTFDPTNGLLYAAIWDQDKIAVLNPANNSVMATFPDGQFVQGATLDPLHQLLIVADGGGPRITLINTTTNIEVGNVSNFNASWLLDPVLDPVTDQLFVSDNILNSVFVYNWTGTTYAPVGSIAIESILSGEISTSYMVLDPTVQRLFVSEEYGSKVTVIDAATSTILTNISVGANPGVPAFDPENGLVYVPASGARSVAVINPSSDKVVRTISTKCGPVMELYDPGSHKVYSLCGSTNISVIDPVTNAVEYSFETVPCDTNTLSEGPGLAIDDAAGELFVTDEDTSCSVSGLNLTEMRIGEPTVSEQFDLGPLEAYPVSSTPQSPSWTWVGGGAAAVIVLVAAVWVLRRRRVRRDERDGGTHPR